MKIVALRQHLRSHQNIQRAAGKRTQCLLELLLGSRCIAVQARDTRSGEFLAQAFFEVLRAFAEKMNILGPAFRTLERYGLNRAAICLLYTSNADLIVANDVTAEGAGFDVDTNIVTLFSRDGRDVALPKLTKPQVAQRILDEIVRLRESLHGRKAAALQGHAAAERSAN